MLARITAFSVLHPSIFSGAWFVLSALIMVSPFAAMMILILGLGAIEGRSVSALIWLMFAIMGLPLLPAFGIGALIGPHILRLEAKKRGQAALLGAAAAFGALLLWVLLLEGISILFGEKMQTAGSGGDVPGAALVVGYLVMLPLVMLTSLLIGAAAGVLLLEFTTRRIKSLQDAQVK